MTKNNYTKTEPDTIKKMFGTIAKRYDRANSVLSLNLHKKWNRKLVEGIETDTLLDICAGTGEIAFEWLKKQNYPKEACLLDFCPEMLKIAKEKGPKDHKICYIEADAQNIPLADNSFGAVTQAYGIRNVKSPSLCFNQVYRVLKTGGVYRILELTDPPNKLLSTGHKFYLRYILPYLGGWITSQPDAYNYLSKSIPDFIKPSDMTSLLSQAGFSDITVTPLNFGIAHIITAKKK